MARTKFNPTAIAMATAIVQPLGRAKARDIAAHIAIHSYV
jgi:hypothetical protein